MSTYCKLVGDKKMAKGKYITINEALDDDDWALIFDKQGDLIKKESWVMGVITGVELY